MKSVNLFFLFILLLFVTACSTYKKGVKSYQQGEYQVAIENLEKSLDKSKTKKARQIS